MPDQAPARQPAAWCSFPKACLDLSKNGCRCRLRYMLLLAPLRMIPCGASSGAATRHEHAAVLPLHLTPVHGHANAKSATSSAYLSHPKARVKTQPGDLTAPSPAKACGCLVCWCPPPWSVLPAPIASAAVTSVSDPWHPPCARAPACAWIFVLISAAGVRPAGCRLSRCSSNTFFINHCQNPLRPDPLIEKCYA